MLKELTGLALTCNYDSCTVQELEEHFLTVLGDGRYLIVCNPQHELVGYLEYQWVSETVLEVRDLIVTERQAIWRLWGHLKRLPYQQLIFRRERTAKWRSYRRSAHAMA